MSRIAWAAAILVGSACGSGASTPAPIVVPTEPVAPAPVVQEPPPPPLDPTPSADASDAGAEPPLPPETPPPPADFTSLADVVKAGAKAMKKMVRLRVRRDHYTSSTQFTAVPCVDKVANATIWLRYKAEQRDWVRAMYGTPPDACATASFKVVAFRGGGAPLVEGTIEHVGTVVPKRAAKPPAGADYASIDDAILAGAEAKGKIIANSFWAYNGDPKELWVHDCKRGDAFLFVIPKTPQQQSLASQLSTSPSRCAPAHLLMADPDYVASNGGESMKRPRADVVSVP